MTLGFSSEEEEKGVVFIKAFSHEEGPDFKKPYSVCAMHGKIYVTDTDGAVFVINRDKDKWDFFEYKGVYIREPLGIACFPSHEMVCISDGYFRRVFCYKENGDFVLSLGVQSGLKKPTGLYGDDTRHLLYVVDTTQHKVFVFDAHGEFMTSFGGRGEKPGQFNYPTNVTTDKATGRVYVSDTMNFRVQVFTSRGRYLFSFGGPGDGPGFFARPRGVAVDSKGRVYVVDAVFNNVQVFDSNGKYLFHFGEPGMEDGKFILPAGIFIDEEDYIYVVDQMNRKLHIFKVVK